eukprot:m51a1_g10395 hypothetical protein (72) ;mRNA; f:64440-65023
MSSLLFAYRATWAKLFKQLDRSGAAFYGTAGRMAALMGPLSTSTSPGDIEVKASMHDLRDIGGDEFGQLVA